MGETPQRAAQTLAEILGWRPALAPVLRVFEPLLTAQEELAEELASCVRAAGLELPGARPERLEQGAPLLAGASFGGIGPCVRAAAEKLLPLLTGLDALRPCGAALADFFLKPGGSDAQRPERLTEAFVSGERKKLAQLAGAHGLEPSHLDFAAGFVVSSVLRAMTTSAVPEEGEAPWDSGAWRQGHCPVCGALPVISWLDRPAADAKNAFLSGGGGKKHLHCGVCGANWKFRRGACPACGREGGVMELLRESGISHGERLDWCTRCRAYCPGVDLREREFVPNMDALALGMMHLDMAAARRKLHPLRPTFWNMS